MSMCYLLAATETLSGKQAGMVRVSCHIARAKHSMICQGIDPWCNSDVNWPSSIPRALHIQTWSTSTSRVWKKYMRSYSCIVCMARGEHGSVCRANCISKLKQLESACHLPGSSNFNGLEFVVNHVPSFSAQFPAKDASSLICAASSACSNMHQAMGVAPSYSHSIQPQLLRLNCVNHAAVCNEPQTFFVKQQISQRK